MIKRRNFNSLKNWNAIYKLYWHRKELSPEWVVWKTCSVQMIMWRRTEKRMKIQAQYNHWSSYVYTLQAQKQMLIFSLHSITVIDFCATVSWFQASMTLWTPQKCGYCRKWVRKRRRKETKHEMKQKRYMLSSNQDSTYVFHFFLTLAPSFPLSCVIFIGNNLKYDAINNKRWQHTFFLRRLHKSCLNKLENATMNDKDIGWR